MSLQLIESVCRRANQKEIVSHGVRVFIVVIPTTGSVTAALQVMAFEPSVWTTTLTTACTSPALARTAISEDGDLGVCAAGALSG